MCFLVTRLLFLDYVSVHLRLKTMTLDLALLVAHGIRLSKSGTSLVDKDFLRL